MEKVNIDTWTKIGTDDDHIRVSDEYVVKSDGRKVVFKIFFSKCKTSEGDKVSHFIVCEDPSKPIPCTSTTGSKYSNTYTEALSKFETDVSAYLEHM